MNNRFAKNTSLLLPLLMLVSAVWAGQTDYSKMSPFVRHVAMQQESKALRVAAAEQYASGGSQTICAFVRLTGNAADVLSENGCRCLATFGDISIADIPINRLSALSTDSRVSRIEANKGTHALLDSVAIQLDVLPAYAGTSLPQAYTGEGVVMGLMDIGFDLTHPNFYNADATEYRISRFWDFLSTDTVGSEMYVGAEYTTQDDILEYAHSRDGLVQTHGTHTLGIAAGSGYDSPYRGMAYDSDICLVSNAVDDDEEFIAEEDLYKYTYATDALGFKYIFDYAESQGLPCVISFSEGSLQDFRGDDLLYYDVLEQLTGPGRIIVSSAGNTGHVNNYFHKPAGTTSAGTFLQYYYNYLCFAITSDDSYDIQFVTYGTPADTLTIASSDILAAEDSIYTTSVSMSGGDYNIVVEAFTSCYDSSRTAYEFTIDGPEKIGIRVALSMELIGEDADIEFYRYSGEMATNSLNPDLCWGDNTHGIHSPGSAPSLISVGATAYRTAFVNYFGSLQEFDRGTDGVLADISSRGPTYDERIKPDVLAPGINIFSSMNSYYMENCPDDLADLIEPFTFNGRTYGWAANSGTSMSSPAAGGIIALWLEADPTLSPSDILDVLANTCRHPDGMTSDHDNDYGYGEIDAYRGLLYILGIDGIEGISASQPTALSFSLGSNNTLRLSFQSAVTSPVDITIYSVAGAVMLRDTLATGSSEYSINLSGLSQGVYAVQVCGAQQGVTGSTLIRLQP